MKKGQLTYKGAVYPWHCDHMGHMNVMWYVGKFDEATWNFFMSVGLSSAKLKKTNRGMAAAEQHLAYKREVVPGDTLEIYTHALEVKSKSVRFVHDMYNAESGEIVATCDLTGVYIDSIARKATELPVEVRARATELIGDRN